MREYHCPLCQAPCVVGSDGATVTCAPCSLTFMVSQPRPPETTIKEDKKKKLLPPDPEEVDRTSPSGRHFAIEVEGYEIVDRIGDGAMSVVFKAVPEGKSNPVAIKVLSGELSKKPALVRRFEREATFLGGLDHPSIVSLITQGLTTDGHFFFAMEFVEGESLRQAIGRGRYSLEQRIDIIVKAADTLVYSHGRNIVHRDIKPENIMVREVEGDMTVKILDFGLVRALEPEWNYTSLTRRGTHLGTPLYMSPEQRDDPSGADGRADIYSLGVVFYELLANALPEGRFKSAHEKNPKVSPDLSAVVDRMLEPDRDDRFQSMEETANSIRETAGVDDQAPRLETE